MDKEMKQNITQDAIAILVITTCIGFYTKSFWLTLATFFFMIMLSNMRADIYEK